MTRLGDICRFQSGGTPPKNDPENYGGNIPWITTVALNGKVINGDNAIEWITEKAIRESAAKIVPAYSIMVGTRVGVGKVAINGVPMATSQDVISLIDIDESKWDKKYLCKLILSKSGYLNAQARGATIKGIKIDALAGIEMPIIPVEEQKKISAAIEKADELIFIRKKQLQKLDDLIKSRFVEMFQHKGFQIVTVHDVLKIAFWLMPATPEFVIDGDVPYITSKNIKYRRIDFENVKLITKETFRILSSNRPTQVGDILISMIGTLGQTAVITDDRLFYGQNLYLLRLNGTIIDTDFFIEFFNLDETQQLLQRQSNQSTQAYLKANNIEDLLLPLPPMDLQKRYAAFVKQIGEKKNLIQKGLNQFKQMKQALMQKYFG